MQPYKINLQKKYDEVYAQLNTQQQLAVDTIEGPVMVIAGPGTGKTQILAARIGKILLSTQVSPQNILCLTYTDAGTIAMRKRLQQFIGADAYKVNIYTFHAFCNDVIQDNLWLFEKNSLDAISELETIELYKKLIDNFKKDNPLKRYRGDIYYEIKSLRNLFSTMKKEGWDAEYIQKKITEYLKDLPFREEYLYKKKYKQFNAGDLKIEKFEEEQNRILKLQAAVNEFENYQTLMRKKNCYDFDDMINWVIKAFEQNKNILINYQEKFQYILVDEFQDTSGTQNKLIELLINYWDVPNIFVVGDDDQSIYRFQGANVENMLHFANTYTSHLFTVVLTNNYRSTQPILDVAKSIINKNEDRLVKQIDGLSKDLVAANSIKKEIQLLPIINAYQGAKDEMASVTNQVLHLINNNIQPAKIAIIYKENKYGEELAKYFQLKNIPIYSKRHLNLLTVPIIKKIVQILRYINAEHDIPYGGDEILFEILHYNFFNILPIEIAKLTVEVNKKKYNGETNSIREMLYDKANAPQKNLFDTGINEGLKIASNCLEILIAEATNLTLQQLFVQTIQQAQILKFILQHTDKISLLQMVSSFFDFIKEETSRNPYLNLNELINIIDIMEKEELPLPFIKIAGNNKGVNFLTAHGSKGLEFEYVFFVGVNASSWEKKRKPSNGFKLPDNMFSSQPTSSEEEELRRLFYVAITRAEIYLHISFIQFKNDDKQLEPSMFIAEIIENNKIEITPISVPNIVLAEYQILNLGAQAPEIEQPEADFIQAILDKFVMNVTALNNYLDCPLKFYYNNLIRIPSGKNEATVFGSAIHFTLDKLFRNMQDSKLNKFESKDEMMVNFKWYMYRHRENFTKEAFDRRLEYGEDILKNYYDKYVEEWNKIVAVERRIQGVVVNGVPLKGALDKLEFDGKNVNIVDYKTGNIDNAISKLKSPNPKEPNGGDYWRQAVFYKILIDNYEQKDWKVISTEFDFVEPDNFKKYRKEKIMITPQDVETVKHQIKFVWDKIQTKDFYTGCGKENCHWCNFVKNNDIAIALHDVIENEN